MFSGNFKTMGTKLSVPAVSADDSRLVQEEQTVRKLPYGREMTEINRSSTDQLSRRRQERNEKERKTNKEQRMI